MKNYEVRGFPFQQDMNDPAGMEKRQSILSQDAFALLGGMVTFN